MFNFCDLLEGGNKMRKVFGILWLVIMTEVLGAQVDTAWVRRYNGPENRRDYAWAIVVDNSGNVYVTGQSYGSGTWDEDYATIKYNSNGDTLWVRRYDRPGNSDEEARAIAVDNVGNVYVTGESDSFGSGTGFDYVTIKYGPNGDTLWMRKYNGPGNWQDNPRAIAVDSGNVYVTGWSCGSGTYFDYGTIKYKTNGDILWVRRYDGPGNGYDYANAITVDETGNVCVTGSNYRNSTDDDYTTIKYKPNGDTAWVRGYNGPGDSADCAWAIAVNNSGNVYVTGYSWGIGTGFDYATIKYTPDGDTAWARRYNGPTDSGDYAKAIAVDEAGNVYVTGYSKGIGTDFDYATIKYGPNGNELWVQRYNGPGDSLDYARAIALDDSGNIYVTGDSKGIGTDFDYATIKYGPNGNELWVQRYNGPGDSTDWTRAIVVDDNYNVYVTGYSWGIGTDFDYATIKYVQKPTRVEESYKKRAVSFSLVQNPVFCNDIVVALHIKEEEKIIIDLYDVCGRFVRRLFSGKTHKGKMSLSAQGVASGIYFLKAESRKLKKVQKVVILK